jgi:hypothetical protein
MSSFDPDDTTPLINPQDSNPNHGTFNEHGQEQEDDEPLTANNNSQPQEAEDDEILDGRTLPSNNRFNPFNRLPNLPPQLADELAATVGPTEEATLWTKFKR